METLKISTAGALIGFAFACGILFGAYNSTPEPPVVKFSYPEIGSFWTSICNGTNDCIAEGVLPMSYSVPCNQEVEGGKRAK